MAAPNVSPELVGIQVDSVRPRNCAQLEIDEHSTESRRIVEWLEHRPPQIGRKVNVTLESVRKCEPQHVITRNLDGDNAGAWGLGFVRHGSGEI